MLKLRNLWLLSEDSSYDSYSVILCGYYLGVGYYYISRSY